MILEKIANEAPPHTLCLYLPSRFRLFHTLALTPSDPDQDPDPDPETRTGQDRTASTGKVQGKDRTGQGRQGQARHRHNSASSDPHIASAKYRITVSHLPSFARTVRAV